MCIKKVNINITLNILNIKSNMYLILLLIIKFIINIINVLLKLIDKARIKTTYSRGPLSLSKRIGTLKNPCLKNLKRRFV